MMTIDAQNPSAIRSYLQFRIRQITEILEYPFVEPDQKVQLECELNELNAKYEGLS